MRVQFKVSSPMRYFWLKRVSGVNLSAHCAQCLLGNYFPGINGKSISGDYELPDGLYYLCGVSHPYNWYRNFHLAFVADPTSNIHYTNNGVDVIVSGARRIEFCEEDVDKSNPHYNDASFRTCRNWQFAHWLVKHGDEVR